MRGKNAGKTRPPQPKRKEVKLLMTRRWPRPVTKSTAVVVASDREESSSDLSVAGPSFRASASLVPSKVGLRSVGSEFAGISFPSDLTSASTHLIRYSIHDTLFPPEFCISGDPMRFAFVQLMFVDEAYFHCVLAIAASSIAIIRGNPIETPDILSHLSQSFNLVNQRLRGDEALSNSTLSVVIGLTIYECILGNQEKARVHFEGLRRIVKLRGGLHQLQDFELVQKLCRIDIKFALHDGTPTLLQWSEINRYIPHYISVGDDTTDLSLHEFSLQIPRKLQTLGLNVNQLAKLCSTEASSLRLNGEAYHGTLLYLAYHLIAYSPLAGPRPTSRIENSFHLGLLSFLTTLLYEFCRLPSLYELLSNLLRVAIKETRGFESMGGSNQTLRLWMLLVGRASVLGKADDVWIEPDLREVIADLGLGNWQAAKTALHCFPWIGVVHDSDAQELVQRIVIS
ncbi:hypothetical protein BX600DRAFT_517300 [Xylariales sp. PMI_506]|nr:hypothetical protein BX600DRAFT_517300 [Xylariales sp. PMI_506]